MDHKRVKEMMGKKVKIKIEVIEDSRPAPTLPIETGSHNRGKYKLGKELDRINIRNFAYEES